MPSIFRLLVCFDSAHVTPLVCAIRRALELQRQPLLLFSYAYEIEIAPAEKSVKRGSAGKPSGRTAVGVRPTAPFTLLPTRRVGSQDMFLTILPCIKLSEV